MGRLELTPVVKHTYEDLAAIPPDLKRWELIDGEFFVTPAPASFHQAVSARLLRMLSEALVDSRQGLVLTAPVDVIFSRFDTVEPDLVVVSRKHAKRVSKRGIEGAPDLVVEILSPSNRMQDLAVKRALYARFKVPEYWIVDPDAKSVEVLVLTRGEYGQHAIFKGKQVARSHQFEAVSVPLRELFAPMF